MTTKQPKKAVDMATQLKDAKSDKEKQKLSNSDLFMVGDFDDKTIFLHEAVWVKHNKKLIPSNMLVYHKDGDPMNNDPDNLDLVLENKEHGDLHLDKNKVFHEHKVDKQFIKKYFEDIYECLYDN